MPVLSCSALSTQTGSSSPEFQEKVFPSPTQKHQGLNTTRQIKLHTSCNLTRVAALLFHTNQCMYVSPEQIGKLKTNLGCLFASSDATLS